MIICKFLSLNKNTARHSPGNKGRFFLPLKKQITGKVKELKSEQPAQQGCRRGIYRNQQILRLHYTVILHYFSFSAVSSARAASLVIVPSGRINTGIPTRPSLRISS